MTNKIQKNIKSKSMPVADIVWQLAEPLADKLDCELVDVEYLKEGGSFYLRIYIDKEPTVDLDLCQGFSEALSAVLDEKDPITDSYYLEVSSPGVERPLKKPVDFQRFAGHAVSVSLYAPFNGKKDYIGELVGLIDNELVLSANSETIKIPFDLVSKTNLKVFF